MYGLVLQYIVMTALVVTLLVMIVVTYWVVFKELKDGI